MGSGFDFPLNQSVEFMDVHSHYSHDRDGAIGFAQYGNLQVLLKKDRKIGIEDEMAKL